MSTVAVTDVQLTHQCRCDPTSGESCTACDGTAAEYLADLLGLDALVLVEPCLGIGPEGWPCDHAAEVDGWCAEHSVLAADRLPADVVLVPAEAA